ncbi:CDA_G0029970.mRNA.1.CDS.1 [Saccharomyces cerevisiae]|nr:CDA_G0029970.mRNA.1.CDS.1 [Saccharomyces cerevisiae]CAI7362850.1 CDA_G0029970.mRNA.1.CDS.1 [Saccharomyces cerevisiae]
MTLKDKLLKTQAKLLGFIMFYLSSMGFQLPLPYEKLRKYEFEKNPTLKLLPFSIWVVSTNGDTHLGGEDFDIYLLREIVSRFRIPRIGIPFGHTKLRMAIP